MASEPIERTSVPKAIALVDRTNTDRVIAYACCDCRSYYLSESDALTCCRCRACGAKTTMYFLTCQDCSKREYEERTRKSNEVMKAKLDAAEAVPESEYEGMIYCSEGYGPQDGYFVDGDELRDYCLDNDREPPSRVWACHKVPLRIMAEHAIEGALDDHHDGASDEISEADEDRLQKLLDEWCDSVGVVSWQAERNKAVILDKSPDIGPTAE